MTRKLNNYKIIFFDWNNTLSKSLFWEQLKNPNHPRHKWYASINNFLFSLNENLVKDWMIGKTNYSEVSYKIAEYLIVQGEHEFKKKRKYHKESDLKKEITELIENDLKKSCKEMCFVSKEVFELLKKLRGRKKSALLQLIIWILLQSLQSPR